MARFAIRLLSPLPAPTAWARLLDLRAHSQVVPLTRMSGEVLDAAALVPGSRFTARTAVGPVGFDDRMVVDEITQPTTTSEGRARIRKEGRVVRGGIDLTVAPSGDGSVVEWEQEIRVAGVPRLLGPVVAAVARLAYGSALRALLARG